jgi:UDP-2,3-diacylglucosamine hydrolase
MKAVFIADAHLDGSPAYGYRYLLRFFDSGCGGADELFILGDFFDFWFAGEKAVYPGFAPIVEKLLEMRRRVQTSPSLRGITIFSWAIILSRTAYGFTPREPQSTSTEKRCFSPHGDMVDTANRGYRALRKLLRSGFFYRTQKHMPSPLLWHISRMVSRMSRGCESSQSIELDGRITAFAGRRLRREPTR